MNVGEINTLWSIKQNMYVQFISMCEIAKHMCCRDSLGWFTELSLQTRTFSNLRAANVQMCWVSPDFIWLDLDTGLENTGGHEKHC